MRKGFCPSFTIENVNLFTGKISLNERSSMTKIVEDKLETNLQCLFEIESDEFGERLKEKSGMDACLQGNSIDFIKGDLVHFFSTNFAFLCYSYLSAIIEKSQIDFDQAGAIKFLQKRRQDMEHAESTCRPQWLYLYKLFGARLKSVLASIQVSATIDASQMLSQERFILDSLNAFESASKIEFIPSRLRLASLCYTNDLHEIALTYLLEVFEKIKDENECAQICSCLHAKDKYNRGTRNRTPKRGFKQKIKDMDDNRILKLRPPCLQFLRFEKNCIPQFLTYEMYRTFTNLEQKSRSLHNTWMDMAMVDSIPFTYYLLFHTYHDMGKHEKAGIYLHLLLKYMKEDNFIMFGHYETTCNMIGHCFQKSGYIIQAYEWYATSLVLLSVNNAAKWHLCFLIRELISLGVKDLVDTPEEVKCIFWD
ncbi:uncharacterized protein LOC128217561 isoform X1 [Mya arenaria]|uniref:uncharacterized protein LOC128217561 isoform X1 n=1 Tax=Mya arenaria TaxID=6604 RepID=UPI0022E3EDAE|nr:uncharacterized protein LOC128217561 isoform X1 [Mya arenaria]